MASTILRVKRRLEENPQDAFVLMCKRKKTDSEAEISPSLFVFRGTVENQEKDQVKSIFPKSDAKLKSLNKVDDIIEKIRKDRKEASTESRYEVVNLSRGLKENTKVKQSEDVFDLVDLEPKKTSEEEDVQYAYDLYTSAKQDFDISMLDNLVSIENYENELIFGSYRDNGRRTPSTSSNEESDDSNDENNWRNDYPDSEHSSIDEEDMIKAVERCEIEDDLSSDAGEDEIYNEPSDLFNEDVKRYGAAYAKYKAKVVSENPDLSDSRNFVHCTSIKEMDEESIDGYKDDSDDGFYYGEEQDSEQFKDQYREEDSDLFDPD